MSICTFNDCNNQAIQGSVKCSFHKNRRQCKAKDCNNQVYARNLCVRHGGKKQCQYEGCDSYARGGNYCIQHGGIVVKRFCSVEGCTKQAHAKQLCVRHGGGRLCRSPGCQHHAREGGLCHKHNQVHKYDNKKVEPSVKSEVMSSVPSSPASSYSSEDDHQASPMASSAPLLPEPLPTSSLDPPNMAANMSMYTKWLQLTQDMLWSLHPDLMGMSYAGLLPAMQLPLASLVPPPMQQIHAKTNFDFVESPKDTATIDPFLLESATPFDVLGLDNDLTHDVFSSVLA
ncbi:hypothetical protein LEN26_008914 [Aphanomyces euteiches]|nr:hypothetical protein AeMF1_019538 [Aphanomyces euteiches]KAH9130043.1 hypothetical protein LEN26_008914 [Aphanomyces euteiches]